MTGTSSTASACTICISYPQKSAADYLIEGSHVVFARENPDEPFSYTAVEVLKGYHDVAPIELFLDSVTRRRLAADANLVAVLTREGDKDPWRSLGLADTECKAVLRRILVVSPLWQGELGKQKRAGFFLALFGCEDPLLSELAYIELGRAPYLMIKRLSLTVPRDQLRAILQDRQYVEWRPLAILMLAHTGTPKDRRLISQSFHTAERFGITTNLAAWAAGSIELNGGEAVSFIETRYFREPERKRDELDAIMKALSLHGTEGPMHLRDRIVESYSVLLEIHPEMAATVATDLLAWKRDELRKKLAAIKASSTKIDYTEQKTINQYLRLADSPTGTE